MTENITDKLDRISQLPDFIIHHILSFFDRHNLEALVRMSVLSKHWFSLTASFPILKFHCYELSRAFYECHSLYKAIFFKYITYTTTRFCEQNLRAHTFDVYTTNLKPNEVDILERCFGLILKKDLQVLKIDIVNTNGASRYRLPNILLSASSLTSMTIRRCELPSSLMVDVFKFKSLKLLTLWCVRIDEGMIKCLTRSSPLLEEINIENCYGFKQFCVFRHQNLKKVQIYCCCEIERIDIEAPNLCYLLLDNSKGKRAPFMNLTSCKKLTTFCYNGVGYTDLLPNFPFIENLILCLPHDWDNLKLSIQSLKKLVLYANCDFDEIDINTPNMVLFEFNSSSEWPGFFVRDDLAQSKPCLKYKSSLLLDSMLFQKLRRFLDKNNQFKTLKLVFSTILIDIDELKVIRSPPYELEHVELKYGYYLNNEFVALVDAIFSCCRPRSLSLKLDGGISNDNRQRHVAKYAYKKLLQQEDQGQINIQIVLSYFSKAKQHFSDLKSLLKALACVQRKHTVTFVKEVVQEAVAVKGTRISRFQDY